MNLLVFGAAGPTGRHVVAQATAAGHRVTAFVRNPPSPALEGARLVQGDATDAAAVAAAMPGQDAVICTLGVKTSFRSGSLMARSLAAIVPAMERSGARRLVVMSALGVGATRAQAPWLPRLMYALLLGDIFRDKQAGERIASASALEWIVVHPPLLTDGPLSGNYRAGATLPLAGFPKISRADVAHFMVGALATSTWLRQHVIVSDRA